MQSCDIYRGVPAGHGVAWLDTGDPHMFPIAVWDGILEYTSAFLRLMAMMSLSKDLISSGKNTLPTGLISEINQ